MPVWIQTAPRGDLLGQFGFKHPRKMILQPCLSSNSPAGSFFGPVGDVKPRPDGAAGRPQRRSELRADERQTYLHLTLIA